jgi:hypothetical protein
MKTVDLYAFGRALIETETVGDLPPSAQYFSNHVSEEQFLA